MQGKNVGPRGRLLEAHEEALQTAIRIGEKLQKRVDAALELIESSVNPDEITDELVAILKGK